MKQQCFPNKVMKSFSNIINHITRKLAACLEVNCHEQCVQNAPFEVCLVSYGYYASISEGIWNHTARMEHYFNL
jgi:hypothetical protein